MRITNTRLTKKKTSALVLSAIMVLSMVAGVAMADDVQRGGDSPTFNPGVGGPNDVVVSEEKPVVFQGEDDLDFVDENGNQVDASTLIGVSGNAEGIPLESPIPRDQELGQYALDGRAQNPGVTVQRPRVTDLEVFNTRGVDVEGSTVQEDETLLISAEWNFQRAEDLSLEVTDEDGNEITGDVLTEEGDLSEAQRERLTGPFAENPAMVSNPGQRGTETGIEYLQGLGQLNETEGETQDLEAAYWAIDLSDQDAGDYTITVEGWDNLDFGSATRSTVVSVTGDDNPVLDVETDEATRGENVRYTIRGSTAGATHIVTIEDTDFRNNQVDERVFRDVEDVVDRGSLDTNDDGTADFAWAQIEIDDDTGIGVGQIDTTYLDDTSVDVNLYDADQNISDVAEDLGDTEDDFSLDVSEGELNIDSPAGTYIAGQEEDVRGTAAPGVDDVAIYVRDQGDWELVDINEDGELNQQDLISVDADGEWEERDVRLSQANDILSIPGRYRLGVVEAVDATQNGTLAETLTTSEFSSATSEQTSIIVTEPRLGGGDNTSLVAAFGGSPMALQDQNNTTQETDQTENPTWVFRTYNEQIAVEDGTVEVTGVAPGLDEVLVVMIDSRGRTVTETVSVDDNDIFEEDDIELVTREGRDLNEGQIRGMVIGLGRDTVVGDGVLPGVDDADLASLESWIATFGTGLTQEQVSERITDETTDEAGSDDLLLTQTFRYADASTSVTSIAPQGEVGQPVSTLQTQTTPIEAGQTMVVQGLTNRRPDDNTITFEVIDGPSADQFDSASTDEWGRTGVWSVNLSTEGVEPGTYTLEVDDGDNTDIVQFEVVEAGQAQEEVNETTEAGNEDAAEGELANTLEIRPGGGSVEYTLTVDGELQAVSGVNETEIAGDLAAGSVSVTTDDTDVYQFDGQVTDFSAQGNVSDMTLVLNGEEVTPDQLGNATSDDASMVGPSAIGA